MYFNAILVVLLISVSAAYPDCWPNGGEPTFFDSSDSVENVRVVSSTEPVSMTNTYFGDEMAGVRLRDAGKTCCTVPPFTVSCASVPSGSSVHIDANLGAGSAVSASTVNMRSKLFNPVNLLSQLNQTHVIVGSKAISFDLSPDNPTVTVNILLSDSAYKGTISGLFYATGNVVVDVDITQTIFATAKLCRARQILASVGPRVYFKQSDCQTIGDMDFWDFCVMKNAAGDGRGGPGVWIGIKHDDTIFKLVMLTRRLASYHATTIADLLIPGCTDALPYMHYFDVNLILDIDPMNNEYIVKIKAGGTIRQGDQYYIPMSDLQIYSFTA